MMPFEMKRKSIHNDWYQDLIEILVSERKQLGLSQEDLADTLQLNQSDVSKIEKLERRVDVLEFVEILTALRISDRPKALTQLQRHLFYSDEQYSRT